MIGPALVYGSIGCALGGVPASCEGAVIGRALGCGAIGLVWAGGPTSRDGGAVDWVCGSITPVRAGAAVGRWPAGCVTSGRELALGVLGRAGIAAPAVLGVSAVELGRAGIAAPAVLGVSAVEAPGSAPTGADGLAGLGAGPAAGSVGLDGACRASSQRATSQRPAA